MLVLGSGEFLDGDGVDGDWVAAKTGSLLGSITKVQSRALRSITVGGGDWLNSRGLWVELRDLGGALFQQFM